ncbi:16S rRNA (cytosine(1402)-N(4))-methyltransferase RsmH [Thermodesulfobacteriota bacterium]
MHQSVLLEEAVGSLSPVDRGIYVDGNLGLGGHTERILEQTSPGGCVIGFEWDAETLELARQRLAGFGSRVRFVHRNFADLKEVLAELDIKKVDGILLDLGLSSFQLDGSHRGFSFKGKEALDMRMDTRNPTSAAELINTVSREDLADIFYHYGEERQARRIAAAIDAERKKEPIRTTDRLVDIIYRAIPKRFHPKKIHVATKAFQGLRIAVNRELDNLVQVLACGVEVLKPGSRFCVISFHSLEDRIVKNAFRENRHYRVLTKKPIVPGEEECRKNPRARSAKLRVAELETQI